MHIAVVKRIVFGFIACGTVLRVGFFELIVKRIGMVKVVFALLTTFFVDTESAVVVISRHQHKRNVLGDPVETVEQTVPLQFVFAVIDIVPQREDELCSSDLPILLRIFPYRSTNNQ